eukprot:360484-Chlamydomonas_euryale.AAC.13
MPPVPIHCRVWFPATRTPPTCAHATRSGPSPLCGLVNTVPTRLARVCTYRAHPARIGALGRNGSSGAAMLVHVRRWPATQQPSQDSTSTPHLQTHTSKPTPPNTTP